MFTLAISCLTTSNLPWFMDLTFQVPVHYCSLQHQTWVPSPVTSTTGCCFCFGFVSSFFLELFLHCSPVACWALLTWGVHLSVSYFFAFLLCQQLGPSNQSYGFFSSHVWMWGLDYKESWAPKNWCFWTVVLDSWESLGLQGGPIGPS